MGERAGGTGAPGPASPLPWITGTQASSGSFGRALRLKCPRVECLCAPVWSSVCPVGDSDAAAKSQVAGKAREAPLTCRTRLGSAGRVAQLERAVARDLTPPPQPQVPWAVRDLTKAVESEVWLVCPDSLGGKELSKFPGSRGSSSGCEISSFAPTSPGIERESKREDS